MAGQGRAWWRARHRNQDKHRPRNRGLHMWLRCCVVTERSTSMLSVGTKHPLKHRERAGAERGSVERWPFPLATMTLTAARESRTWGLQQSGADQGAVASWKAGGIMGGGWREDGRALDQQTTPRSRTSRKRPHARTQASTNEGAMRVYACVRTRYCSRGWLRRLAE